MSAPDTPALTLAALRAQGVVKFSVGIQAIESAASVVGRRVVRAGDQFVLAWDASAEIDPGAARFHVYQLSTVPLVVLGACIGLCWGDRSGPLFPGQPTSVTDVIRAVTRLGLSSPTSHAFVKSALDHSLPAAGLVCRRGDEVRLGPQLAAWPETDVDNLRRSAHLLPELPDA